MVVVVLVGPPMSGKKTVAKLLETEAFTHIELESFARLLGHSTACKNDVDARGDDFATEGSSSQEGYGEPEGTPKLYSSQAVISALHKHFLQNWRDHFVLTGITSTEEIEILKKRPSVLIANVDAPFKLRYDRYLLSTRQSETLETIKSFIERNDSAIYGDYGRCHGRLSRVQQSNPIMILNDASLSSLGDTITSLNFKNPNHLRPSWDTYFMHLAYFASCRSSCIKRRVGAVVSKSNRVISTGYNGTVSSSINCNEGGCERCLSTDVSQGQSLDSCICIHAETNALLEAGREKCVGATIYVTCTPCLACSKHIAQVGIQRVMYGTKYGAYDTTLQFLQKWNVKVESFFDMYSGVAESVFL